MNRFSKTFFLVVLAWSPLVATAEERGTEILSASNQPGTTSATVPGRALTAGLDLRPSYAMERQSFHSENEILLKYAFTPTFALAWVQEFHTNVSNPSTQGLDFRLADGYLRADVDNIWQSPGRRLTLSYQGRLYAPTARDVRPEGFRAELRNYFRLGWKFADGWELAFKEVPVIPVYGTGAATVDGQLIASPWFENRVELELNVAITSKLALKFPLILQSFRGKNAAGALGSGAWRNVLWVYPELIYSFSPQTGVGLGYYSANLIEEPLRGIKNGIPQLILQQSI